VQREREERRAKGRRRQEETEERDKIEGADRKT